MREDAILDNTGCYPSPDGCHIASNSGVATAKPSCPGCLFRRPGKQHIMTGLGQYSRELRASVAATGKDEGRRLVGSGNQRFTVQHLVDTFGAA